MLGHILLADRIIGRIISRSFYEISFIFRSDQIDCCVAILHWTICLARGEGIAIDAESMQVSLNPALILIADSQIPEFSCKTSPRTFAHGIVELVE